MNLHSGVEKQYLARLITLRPGCISRPRNTQKKNRDKVAVFLLRVAGQRFGLLQIASGYASRSHAECNHEADEAGLIA